MHFVPAKGTAKLEINNEKKIKLTKVPGNIPQHSL
jgi:hypothetical protein